MMKRRWFLGALFLLFSALPLLAQAGGSLSKVYEVKYRSAAQLQELLKGVLAPQAQGTRISSSREFNTLQVYGTPEVHEIVADLLAKYDKPAPEFELRFYILQAGQGTVASQAALPPEIKSILEEVSELTRYEDFQLVDSPILRLTVGRPASLSGEAQVSYSLRIGNSTVFGGEDSSQLRVEDFEARFTVLGSPGTEEEKPHFPSARIGTSFTIADGEKLVLGTSQLATPDSHEPFAIITIVHAKKL